MRGKEPLQSGCISNLPPDLKRQTLVVAFFDLTSFAEWSSSEEDELIAGFLQSFYGLAAGSIEKAGGRIVKFMGDAGLCVFPKEAAESGILALCELTRLARARARESGLDAYLNINVHVGPLLTGSFGTPGAERFDVIGKTVNIAARLGRRGVTLSAQAFRCLSPEARQRFEKVTRHVMYRFRNSSH
jgi:class 3 adenylate cyclase